MVRMYGWLTFGVTFIFSTLNAYAMTESNHYDDRKSVLTCINEKNNKIITFKQVNRMVELTYCTQKKCTQYNETLSTLRIPPYDSENLIIYRIITHDQRGLPSQDFGQITIQIPKIGSVDSQLLIHGDSFAGTNATLEMNCRIENPETPKAPETNSSAVDSSSTSTDSSLVHRNDDLVACHQSGQLIVRSQKRIKDSLFVVNRGEVVKVNKKAGKKTHRIDGQKFTYVEATFPARNESGWVAEKFLKPRSKCFNLSNTDSPIATQPDNSQQKPKPTKPAKPVKPDSDQNVSDDQYSSKKVTCAQKIILKSAKKTVARVYGNRSYSGGLCALGVRQSLQASGVGGISGGIGNAVDFYNRLPQFGFVLIKTKDPRQAPAGAIIVLDGPYTKSYFKSGIMRRPYGNYVGHVAIKGDDGKYYTDGRTDEVAVGWSRQQNKGGIRNVMGIFVPGNSLVQKHEHKCQ